MVWPDFDLNGQDVLPFGIENISFIAVAVPVKKRILATLNSLDKSSLNCGASLPGGLRIYYTFRGEKIILLLTGGDKSSQAKDIAKAEQILTNME